MALLSTGRALLDARAILKTVGLASGMRYADFGAGALGHFVFPASEMVGSDGHVYAVDVLKEVLSAIESRIRIEGTKNLEAVWGDVERPGGSRLPDHSLDLVSLVNMGAVMRRSPSVADEAMRVLKPGGRLLVVDWNVNGASFGPAPEQRTTPDATQMLLLQKGFKSQAPFRAGPSHWGLVLQRP